MWSLFSRDPSKDFAFEVNDAAQHLEGTFWTLHKGKKKATGETVSVFRYEFKPNEESYLEAAKNAIKRLKTLRHPSILTYFDSLETEKYLLVVTECVEPLHAHLENQSGLTTQQREFAISWGVLAVSKGLCFLNSSSLIHGNLGLPSIFVNNAGDWKISNFEYLSHVDDSFPYKTYYNHKKYTPPELSDANRKLHKNVDSWGFGCLIWEIYNGFLADQEKLRSLGKIPKKIGPQYMSLISANIRSRSSIQDFVTKAQQPNGYFKNVFIESMVFLEEIQIKDSVEKNRFFSNLNNRIDSFPSDVCTNKILPLIISSLEYGEASTNVLELLFKIGKVLPETEYQKKMVPCIIKLFSSKDRSIRSKLLKEMETYAEFIPANLINDQIFPNLVQGFLDSNPIIREQTVKSIYYMAPKLNSQNLNEEVMKHFARIQFKDPEGGIRTNTIVCLGKIAGHLQPQTRQNMMLPAFIRSLRDPFPPSRIAGILSLSATQNFFTLQDCTSKIMPVLCTILMDPEKQVRDHVFTSLKSLIAKMEKFSEDPTLIKEMESEINQSGSNVSAKLTSGLSWAVSSIAAKLTRTRDETQDSATSSNSNKIGNLPATSAASRVAATSSNNQPKSISHSDGPPKTALGGTSADTKSFASDLDSQPADGWADDDGWDNDDDITNELGELKFEDDKPSTTSKTTKFAPIKEKNTANSWDDDLLMDDWNSDWQSTEVNSKTDDKAGNFGNDEQLFQEPAVRKPAAARAIERNRTGNTAANSNLMKKGPMKLGAQKSSKTN